MLTAILVISCLFSVGGTAFNVYCIRRWPGNVMNWFLFLVNMVLAVYNFRELLG